MQIFQGKTIILGAPKHFGFDEVIENDLKEMGFKTINISFYGPGFKYKNLFQRIRCFLYRNLFGVKDYKNKLIYKANQDRIDNALKNSGQADYALIIRPDVFPIDTINSLRSHAKKLVAYHWDGLTRHPPAYKRIKLFDRFFVFDNNDLSEPSVLPITNFYFEAIDKSGTNGIESDALYMGTYSHYRMQTLGPLIEQCRALGLRVSYHLLYKRPLHIKQYNMTTSTTTLSYAENEQRASHTNILIDLVNPWHNGLSFRFFEAIRYQKKIITTNSHVRKYDFYHPNNIFVWANNNNMKELEEFINKPYVALSEDIRDKYSFRNWLQYALDEGEYVQLSIPC